MSMRTLTDLIEFHIVIVFYMNYLGFFYVNCYINFYRIFYVNF